MVAAGAASRVERVWRIRAGVVGGAVLRDQCWSFFCVTPEARCVALASPVLHVSASG
ncbi:conserved hypothetical protein [Xanthomonas phaseoli pv. phaseoli]|uniref:Uncharacterized protein n=1 Tax=Xanthomonas campestris pv. phaseoli TaxID=317013 RepID=A0AB38DZ14_XANCH|nr:conserved hypothetical protein [Xanthomonas phaseoli pv. phaseoli]SON83081.1 conserved hypothetical protein [Xanthomonas phaseoli pv. phaseoli]SON87259.1 conserved hypothetical protein [Xanthomonas phaseoli pv. phaseoli]SOO27209.1 hypothetical protein XAP6164_1380005 [Xanthomonas phaseoli pv. phaseoli]